MIAALHWNYNTERAAAKRRDGEERYQIHYPKSKKGHCTVREVKEEVSYGTENT